MSGSKNKYEQFTLVLDPNDEEDAAIAKWLKSNRTKSRNTTDHLRLAVIDYIAKIEAAKQARAAGKVKDNSGTSDGSAD